MVFIIGASRLYPALEKLGQEEKTLKKHNIFTLPWLGLKYYSKNPRKVVKNLLAEELKGKNELVIWHDVLNSSISAHASNSNLPLIIFELLKELNSCNDWLRGLVYCPLDRTSDIFNIFNQKDFSTMNIVKDLNFFDKTEKTWFVEAVESRIPVPRIRIQNTLSKCRLS